MTLRGATLREAMRRLLGRDALPDGFTGRLDADEYVLASARLVDGEPLVASSLGLWLPGPDGERRLGWHLISKASWRDGAIGLVEAREVDVAGGAVLIADLPVERLHLIEPGRVPEIVQERVTASIRSRHHRELPADARSAGAPRSVDARSAGASRGADARSSGAPQGGAWFVQRKVPGRDGTVLQVRADPGTDPAAVRQVAADVARTLGLTR